MDFPMLTTTSLLDSEYDTLFTQLQDLNAEGISLSRAQDGHNLRQGRILAQYRSSGLYRAKFATFRAFCRGHRDILGCSVAEAERRADTADFIDTHPEVPLGLSFAVCRRLMELHRHHPEWYAERCALGLDGLTTSALEAFLEGKRPKPSYTVIDFARKSLAVITRRALSLTDPADITAALTEVEALRDALRAHACALQMPIAPIEIDSEVQNALQATEVPVAAADPTADVTTGTLNGVTFTVARSRKSLARVMTEMGHHSPELTLSATPQDLKDLAKQVAFIQYQRQTHDPNKPVHNWMGILNTRIRQRDMTFKVPGFDRSFDTAWDIVSVGADTQDGQLIQRLRSGLDPDMAGILDVYCRRNLVTVRNGEVHIQPPMDTDFNLINALMPISKRAAACGITVCF
jgi:hypothetical protein